MADRMLFDHEPVRSDSRRSRPTHARLSVVIPCFNEAMVIGRTHLRLLQTLGDVKGLALQVIYVNDGSDDGTEAILYSFAETDARVRVLTFSRNFGHQASVSAGIADADGDIVAVIDSDLQDPPEVILEMIERWREGYDVIYGIRARRKERPLKRAAYAAFYRLFRRVADIEAPLDAGDFSLIDRRVVDVLNTLPEKNRFLRGLRSWAGFRQTGVVYERAARAAGESKYSWVALLKLAANGIFNFSTMPLTLVFFAGLGVATLSLVSLVFIVVQRLADISVFGVHPSDVPGFATMAFIMLFIGGVQLVSLGIVGEYIGRIYHEVKQRPAYVVARIYQRSDEGQTRTSPAMTPEAGMPAAPHPAKINSP